MNPWRNENGCAAEHAPTSPPDLDTLPDKGDADPVAAVERKDLLEVVRGQLAQLPDQRRAAVEMKIVEGLTYREISEALGAPLGTVAFWVRESLDTIARKLRHLK